MAYTLRGRLESRLAAALLPLAVACALVAALAAWWPLELAGVMLAVGVALDVSVYHPLLRYQPGWLALPLGLLELGLVMAVVLRAGIAAPLAGALGLFWGAWLCAQLLGHAGFPLLRLSYSEDGGELGTAGAAAALGVVALLAGSGGVAWAMRPPTVHLAAGVHAGPIVIRRAETLVGAPGAVVRGGIVIRASHVTVRGVVTAGGENGIDVDASHDVALEHVTVRGASVDGIHVRRSTVTIRDCAIHSGANPWAQGIDISFGADFAPTVVERCTVTGGREGIVANATHALLRDNRVSGTSLRAIELTEMAMGTIERNRVDGALGVGIFCGDHSMCNIVRNHVTGTRADTASGDSARAGFAVLAHFGATAELSRNTFAGNGRDAVALVGARLDRH